MLRPHAQRLRDNRAGPANAATAHRHTGSTRARTDGTPGLPFILHFVHGRACAGKRRAGLHDVQTLRPAHARVQQHLRHLVRISTLAQQLSMPDAGRLSLVMAPRPRRRGAVHGPCSVALRTHPPPNGRTQRRRIAPHGHPAGVPDRETVWCGRSVAFRILLSAAADNDIVFTLLLGPQVWTLAGRLLLCVKLLSSRNSTHG